MDKVTSTNEAVGAAIGHRCDAPHKPFLIRTETRERDIRDSKDSSSVYTRIPELGGKNRKYSSTNNIYNKT